MAAYSTPLGKFEHQRQQAKQRGIAWDLTFDEWWAIWQDSGKWELRGPRVGQYVMARRGDAGPYSRSNVFICTSTENRRQAYVNGRCNQFQTLGTGRGWTFKEGRRRPYQVSVSCRFVGSFMTQEEAEAAYRGAVLASAERIAARA